MISRDTNAGFTTLRNIAKPLESNATSLSMKRIVADYLWRSINNETEQFIRQHLQDLDVDSITYAMHIRRGDKAKEADAIPNENYLAGVEHFRQRESPSSKYTLCRLDDDYLRAQVPFNGCTSPLTIPAS